MDLVLQIDARKKPSVLNRILAVFHRRGFHIESMTVGGGENASLLRMIIVVDADQKGATQLEGNLYNLVDVLQVKPILESSATFRTLALVRVISTPETKSEILRTASDFHSRVLETARDSIVLEALSSKDTIDKLFLVLKPFGILDFARTNCLALAQTDSYERPAVRETTSGEADLRTIALGSAK